MALPGDTISIVDGFYRNNNYEEVLGLEDEQIKYADLPESECWKKYVQTYPYDKNIKWTAYHFGPMYIPRKGDVMNITPYEATLYKMILAWETGEPIECDWESNIVWAGDKHLTQHQWQHDYYFMAGDNVLDSDDSRFWGVVPEEYIVGIVDYKFSTK
jgi:signal peptidase I